MANLKRILDRLVDENLHGPIGYGSYDPLHHNPQRVSNGGGDGTHRNGGGTGGAQSDQYRDRDYRSQAEADAVINAALDPDFDRLDPRWYSLFQEYFVSDNSDDRNDDLLFFVQRSQDDPIYHNNNNNNNNSPSPVAPDPVFVKRKVKDTSNILTPEQEAVVLWKETFFLNLIVQLQCKLTVAVCSRVADTNEQTGITKTSMICTKRHVSKRVYALPTKSRMDVKEDSVECSWPLIYFMIDDYEDMFEQLMLRDEEYLCVELAVTIPTTTTAAATGLKSSSNNNIAGNNRQSQIGTSTKYMSMPGGIHESAAAGSSWQQDSGLQQGKPFPSNVGGPGGRNSSGKITLFQGAAGFDKLLQIYQQKSASKLGRRFKIGQHKVPTEFVMMRGPGGKGHAQVAITASSSIDEPVSPPSSPPQSSGFASRQHSAAGTGTIGSPASPIPGITATAGALNEKLLPPIPDVNSNHSTGNLHNNSQYPPLSQSSLLSEKLAQQKQLLQEPVDQYSSSSSSKNTNGGIANGNGTVKEDRYSKPLPPRSTSSNSFFNSLRKISFAAFVQASAAATAATNSVTASLASSGSDSHQPHSSSSPSSSVSPSPQQQHQQGSWTTEFNSPPPVSSSSSVHSAAGVLLPGAGINSEGLGSRQAVEALVKQPPRLRCCMTFVNVPWTTIVGMLLEQAYANR